MHDCCWVCLFSHLHLSRALSRLTGAAERGHEALSDKVFRAEEVTACGSPGNLCLLRAAAEQRRLFDSPCSHQLPLRGCHWGAALSSAPKKGHISLTATSKLCLIQELDLTPAASTI